MCQNASDILTVLFLMKINGMLETVNGEITRCPFDVTGRERKGVLFIEQVCLRRLKI